MGLQADAGTPASHDDAARRNAMAVFARASGDELKAGLEKAGCTLDCENLRAPEVGLVMARGRISGTGQPFNVGEVTVTRAAVRIAQGAEGFSYLLGRDPERARLAALADAHWQRPDVRDEIERTVVRPVRQRLDEERRLQREQVAATQVDFFTMVRGED